MIAKNNIDLFHGTNSNALPSILKYGLNSVDESLNKGITVSTGEKWSRINGKRSFISFADDIDTASRYASIKMPTKKKDTSFGVIIGISSDQLNKLQTCYVHSDIPEVGIKNNVPLEYINFIAVPKDKVNFVNKLINTDQITVMPIDLDEKFYSVDIDYFDIEFDSEKAKEVLEKTNNSEQKANFDSESLKNIATERKISGILRIYRKLKEKLHIKKKEVEDVSRNQ